MDIWSTDSIYHIKSYNNNVSNDNESQKKNINENSTNKINK